MDVGTIFNRPSKFFAIVRHPIDRFISSFFHCRTENHLISYPFIKDLSLEQYLDSGIGLDADNHQVRVLSGCSELGAQWDPHGRRILALPVESRHLERAKRNIKDRFIAAAALEQFAALVWFLKRLYGWPTRRVVFRRYNVNAGRRSATDPGRPELDRVSYATRRRLTEMNRYDMELYEWIRERFMQQIQQLEPAFSQEVQHLERLNEYLRRIDRTLPSFLLRAAKRPLDGRRRAPKLQLSAIEKAARPGGAR